MFRPELVNKENDEISVVPESGPASIAGFGSSAEHPPLPVNMLEKGTVGKEKIEWMNKYESPSDLQSIQAAKKSRKKATMKEYAMFLDEK